MTLPLAWVFKSKPSPLFLYKNSVTGNIKEKMFDVALVKDEKRNKELKCFIIEAFASTELSLKKVSQI